jgi:hypothetical protein
MKATFFSSAADFSAASIVSSSCHLVGRQCKEGRNKQAAAEAVNRRLVAWKTNKAVSGTVGGITIQWLTG